MRSRGGVIRSGVICRFRCAALWAQLPFSIRSLKTRHHFFCNMMVVAMLGIWLVASVGASVSQGSCYTLSTHEVTCDVPEASCSSPNFWYAPGYVSKSSDCCHCKASCENTSDSCNYYDTSSGSCYNMTTHEVSCDVAQASCASPNVWYAPGFVSSRSGCCHCQQSCENVSDTCNYYDVPDAPASSATTTPRPAWGCYDVSTHTCNCDVSEAECSGTWTRSCTDCSGDGIQTSAAKSNSSLLVLVALLAWMFFQVEAGTGCYNVETHRCDCKVDEATCHQRQGTWTDGCNSCDASTNTHHPQCEKQYSWGCFNSVSHSCECTVSERACDTAVNKSWTHECWSCCHGSAWGCYVPGNGPESGCHCGIYEGACNLDFPDATWSHQCFECEEDPQNKVNLAETENGSGVVIAVVVAVSTTLVLVCLVTLAICLVRKAKKEPPANQPYNSPSWNADVVVGVAAPGQGGQGLKQTA